eukprot:13248346-Ditylum_brightwellii.AAC.1
MSMQNKRLGQRAMKRVESCVERKPTTSTFIDLVSNYDLVVHSIAALALQQVDMSKEPIFYTFSTLQDMGNGAAPCILALVSTPILIALHDKGYRAASKCCITKEFFELVGYCFVEDFTIAWQKQQEGRSV